MIKIKLESWWADTPSLNARMIRQFVSDEDLKNFSLVNENPDYTIVFGRTDWDKIETPKEKTFYISQEPLWSPNQPKDDIHNYCSKILISDKRDYPDREEYIETLLPMFYAGKGESDYREEWDWSYKIRHKKFYEEKNKNLSLIVTNNYNSHLYHLSNPKTNRIIYKERVDITNALSENFSDIDIWGTFFSKNEKNIHGELWNKLFGLKNHKFSIVFENTIQKNYISEKFWDCVLTDTIPIYFGCDNIENIIDNDCYFNLTKLVDNQEDIMSNISFILNNADSIYKNYLPKILSLKNDFFIKKEFNLWERIKYEIEN